MKVQAKIYLTGERFKTFGYYELTHRIIFEGLIWKSIEPDPDITLILYKSVNDTFGNPVYLKFREDDFEHYSLYKK